MLLLNIGHVHFFFLYIIIYIEFSNFVVHCSFNENKMHKFVHEYVTFRYYDLYSHSNTQNNLPAQRHMAQLTNNYSY